jgi:catechol 2,3-dioxygenase-like lactoylglutathione lyase family enzyme
VNSNDERGSSSNVTTIGLHHFNLRVSADELAALRAFYIEVVGLSVGPRPPFNSIGTWLYTGSTPILHLTQMNSGETVAPGSPSALPQSPENRCSAFDHIALACTDLDGYLVRLNRHGIQYIRTEVPSIGEVQLFFRDPSGVAVELIFSSPDKTQSGPNYAEDVA